MEIQVGNYEVVLHSKPIEVLDFFAQTDRRKPESGGIILGKMFDSQINIFKLSIPTPLDFASRANFERHKLSAQIIIEYEFLNSGGQLIYLGEWHTHPESFPTPSPRDLQMIREQFKSNILNEDFILLLIRGTNAVYLRVVDNDSFFEASIPMMVSG